MIMLKGIVYGSLAILPGVSGSMIALYFGDYQKVLSIFANRCFDMKSLTYLLKILLGICIGIFITSCFLIIVINKYFFLFKIFLIILNLFLIVGLITKKQLKTGKIFMFFCLCLLILIFLRDLNLKMDNIYALYIFSGVVYSCANTVPGLSGTAILVNIGFYNILLAFYSNPIRVFLSNPVLWIVFFFVFFITSLFVLKVIYKYFNTQIFNYAISCVLFINTVLLLY